jgi:8-oxo-dGTP pyrophosphatase MutT (NUDIX family)
MRPRHPDSEAGRDGLGPAADPRAPYARIAVVGLIHREDQRGGLENRVGLESSRGLESRGGPEERGGPEGLSDPDGRGRNWLLIHRVGPEDTWDPPGGRMERGEDLTAAVVREVAEETGLAIQVGGPCYALLTLYKGERLLAVSMACQPIGDSDRLTLEPEEAREWRWVSAGDWERLAADGRSSWDPEDVKRATRMATALWEAEKA